MGKIKETITALTAGEFPSAVQMKRKESMSMTDWRFEMVLKCVSRVSAISAGAALVLFAETPKLIAALVFLIFIAFVYFVMRD